MKEITPFNKLKIISHADKIEQLLEGKIPSPVRIVLEPTNLCNHNCFFCSYTSFRDDNQVFLSREKLFELAEDFKKLGVKSVSLVGGGEPMIHPAIYDLIHWFYENKILISITTNGSAFKDSEIDTIVRASTYIRISLNAASTETHNLINNPKTDQFERIVSNIEKIRMHRDKIGSNMLIGIRNAIHDRNAHEIEEMIALAKRLKVDYIMFAAVLWENAASDDVVAMAKEKTGFVEATASPAHPVAQGEQFEMLRVLHGILPLISLSPAGCHMTAPPKRGSLTIVRFYAEERRDNRALTLDPIAGIRGEPVKKANIALKTPVFCRSADFPLLNDPDLRSPEHCKDRCTR